MADRTLKFDILVDAKADTKRAAAEIGSFAQNMKRDIERAIKSLPDIHIGADSTDAQLELAAIRKQLQDLSRQRVGIDIDPALVKAQIDDIAARLRKLGAESPNVQVKADAAAALKALGAVEAAEKRIDGSTATVHVKADTRDLDKVKSALSDLSGLARSSAIGAGIAGIIGAGAAGIGGAEAGIGALALQFGIAKAAIGGSADALKAYDKALKDGKGDFTEYNRLLAQMSPAQREFTKAVIEAKGPLSDLQKSAANSFLPGLVSGIKGATTLFPVLDAAVTRTGGIMGDTATRLGALFRTDKFKADLDAFLRSTEPVTRAIGDSIVTLTGKLVEFGAKMAPAGQGLADFIKSTTTGISGFLDQLAPHADSFKRIFDALGRIVEQLLPLVGKLAGALADELAPVLESVAGWLERNQGMIAAIVPHVGDLVAAIQGLRLARGIESVLAPIATAIFSIVRSSEGSGKVGAFAGNLGLLKGLAIAGGLAAAAVAMDQVNQKSQGGNLSGWAGELHDIVEGGKEIATLDFGSIFGQITEQLAKTKENIQSGQSLFGEFLGFIKRSLTEPLPPMKFDVDTGPGRSQVRDLLSEINAAAPMVTINGNPNPAGFALREVIDEINAGKGEVNIDGRNIPAQEALQYVIGLINNGVGTVNINGNDVPAGQALADFLGRTNSSVGTITIDGNTDPATGKTTQAVQFADGSKGTITIDGNNVPANGKVTGSVQFADGSRGTITIDGNQTPANGKINATVTYANGRTGTIQVNANTGAANSQIQGLVNRWNGYTIDIRTVVSSHVGGLAAGGIVEKMAAGGITQPVARFDNGGSATTRRLRPLAGGYATIVPPQTWRVVGDRMRDNEAFIPINRSPRSRAILATTAHAMGYSIVGMQSGGTLASPTQTRVFDAILSAVSGGGVSSLNTGNSELLNELRTLNGQIRALRGDVDQTGSFNSLASRIDLTNRLLAARGVGSAVMDAATARTRSELGAFY